MVREKEWYIVLQPFLPHVLRKIGLRAATFVLPPEAEHGLG